MSKSILITGATGFVGSKIYEHAKSQNYKVWVCSRSESLNKLSSPPDGIVISQDMFKENVDWWCNVLKNIDIVIHCAWFVKPQVYLNSDKQIDCLLGSIQIAQAAISAGVQTFISLGTCFEYDITNEDLSTKTRLNPKSLYGAAKVSLYLLLKEMFDNTKIRFIWPRLFYLYGENEHPDRLHEYINYKCSIGEVVNLGDGEKIRDYMNVSDAALEILNLIKSEGSGAINICSGIPQTIKSIATQIASKYQNESNLQFNSSTENTFDPFRVVGIKGY